MPGDAFSFEVEFTEFTAQHLWHHIRGLFQRHLTPRCKRCILSKNYKGLNADGLCPLCEAHARSPESKSNPVTQAHRDQLDLLLRGAMGKGSGAYDAIILFSGGKDSSYMLHRIMRDYPGLRLLSLLVDNGFLSPFAVRNVERVLRHFDVPHVTAKLKPSFVKKVFHHALTHLHEQTSYSIVDLMDAKMSFDHAKNLAVALGAPLVICGLGKVQTEILYAPVTVELPLDQECAQLPKYSGMNLRDIYDAEEMRNWYDESRVAPEKRPRFLLPFTVWDTSEDEVLAEVDRLGLISRKRSRPLVTNNALIPVIGMAEVARFGYCSWEIEFGRMVREGKSDRRYWLNIFEMLEYSTKTGKFVNRTVEQTLAALGLTKREIGIGS
jgi:hypothetical protein